MTQLPVPEAIRRIEHDHALLDAAVHAAGADTLTEPYRVAGGPLGDFCESLHDLVAHVLMWDEINLAALSEARAGRRHWSLDPQWELPDAGRRLNRGGVAAGRELPSELLLHRLDYVRGALLAELRTVRPDEWTAPTATGTPARTLGGLVQYVMTVPGASPFWHAAIHLGQVDTVREEPA